MQLGRLMLIKQRMKRNLLISSDGNLTHSLRFDLSEVEGKPWKQELKYWFTVNLVKQDEETGQERKTPLFCCSGSYAAAFKGDSDSAEGSSSKEACELAWPFIRSNVSAMLSSANLILELPYYVDLSFEKKDPSPLKDVQ